MSIQGTGGMAYYLICAFFGLVILGMAANEWRRLQTGDYKRITIAAAILVAGRLAGALMLLAGLRAAASCQEWTLEGLVLAAFTWAFLFEAFASPRRAALFLFGSIGAVAGLLVLCLFLGSARLSIPLYATPWPAALLLLNIFALVQWFRHRHLLSPWLGSAFAVSSLGLGSYLFGFQQGALLGHLAALPLFAIETYRSVLNDLGAYGEELQAVSQRALEQTQDMAFLLEVGQVITASLELPVVLERVSGSVARAVDADWAYVLLPSGDDPEKLSVAARYGWWGKRWTQDSQPGREIVIDLSDFSILRHAILRRRQVVADRPDDYEQFGRLHDLLSRAQNGPTLVQPIYLQEQSLGVMLLGHVGNQRTFSDDDARLCQALVTQMAIAIDNARLYQSLDLQARRLAELLRVRDEEVVQRQAILESITDGVVVASEADQVVLANAAAERILGVPRQKLLGKTIRRLYAEFLRSGGRGSGSRAVFEWGNKIVMGSMAPVKMPDGALLGYVAVFRDVTLERQSEQSKAKFVAAVSHELRTPLTSIKGYVELLAAGAVGNIPPQQRHFLDIVGANTERMVSLVNNLIAVSEMESGAIEIEARPVDMKNVIHEAVQAQSAKAAEGQLELVVDLPPRLSPAWGDPPLLRQIMDNLLDNAINYTPAKGCVTIWAAEAHLDEEEEDSQDYLVVSIRDTGVGIPPEEHERIFEKFYRVDNPLSLEVGGTGMGLAIVKSLVEAHGGRIWLESQPGSGSTFSVAIPASNAS